MDLHVCKSCGTIANFEATGRCLASVTGKHLWLSGAPAEDYMRRLWQLRSHAVSAAASGPTLTRS